MNLPGRKPVTLADVTGPRWSDHHPLAPLQHAINLARIAGVRRERHLARLEERLAEIARRRR